MSRESFPRKIDLSSDSCNWRSVVKLSLRDSNFPSRPPSVDDEGRSLVSQMVADFSSSSLDARRVHLEKRWSGRLLGSDLCDGRAARRLVIEPPVINQVAFLPERQAAVGAAPRFLVRVDQSVTLELVLDAKTAAADVTGVRFLAGVLGDVQRERWPRAECLAALAALIREDVGVRAIVHEQGGLLLERFAAHVAHVRPLARVNASVILDVSPRREHAAAQVARHVLDAVVCFAQMSRQALIHAEPLAAQVTREHPLARVDPYVPVERVRRI